MNTVEFLEKNNYDKEVSDYADSLVKDVFDCVDQITPSSTSEVRVSLLWEGMQKCNRVTVVDCFLDYFRKNNLFELWNNTPSFFTELMQDDEQNLDNKSGSFSFPWKGIEDKEVLSYFGSKLNIPYFFSVKSLKELFQILFRRYNCDVKRIKKAVRKGGVNNLSILERLCAALLKILLDDGKNEFLSIAFLLLGNDRGKKVTFLRTYFVNPESVIDNELASVKEDLHVLIVLFSYPYLDEKLKSSSPRTIISLARSSKGFVEKNYLAYEEWKKIILYNEFERGETAGWLAASLLLQPQIYSVNLIFILFFFVYEQSSYLTEFLNWMYESGPEQRAILISICNSRQYGDINKWLDKEYEQVIINDIPNRRCKCSNDNNQSTKKAADKFNSPEDLPKIKDVLMEIVSKLDNGTEIRSLKQLSENEIIELFGNPRDYKYRDLGLFEQSNPSIQELGSYCGLRITPDDYKFVIFVNSLANIGYLENTEENLQRFVFRLTGRTLKDREQMKDSEAVVKLLSTQYGKGTNQTSKALWYIIKSICDTGNKGGSLQDRELKGSVYEKSTRLFAFSTDEQRWFADEKNYTQTLNHRRADDRIKVLLFLLFNVSIPTDK